MNISYNWLKEYVDFDLTPDEVAAALTSIGLETGSVEEVQTIKGGLESLVIGEVLYLKLILNSRPHAHHYRKSGTRRTCAGCGRMRLTWLSDKKVAVARTGAKLYDGDECFTIKKSKLRGVESNGMICAEDEIGIGTDHAGIIVLRKRLCRVRLPRIIITSRAITCWKWILLPTVLMRAHTTA